MNYKPIKTAWKAGATFLMAFAVMAVYELGNAEWPEGGLPDVNAWAAFFVPMAMAAARAALDWRKHGGYMGMPVFDLPSDRLAP